MSNDDLDHIPSIVPTRDPVTPRPAGGGRGARKATAKKSAGGKGDSGGAGGSGSGPLVRLLLTVALVVAGVACAWAWQLQQQLETNRAEAEGYARRIQDLEARLSDTDEGMNQNAQVQATKIRELDLEVRKLWDNVWKQANERLTKLENDNAIQGKKITAGASSVTALEKQVKDAAGDIAKLNSVAGDLERLIASGKSRQAEVERVADSINRVNLDLAKLNKRVQSNEEWIQSINAFRKQVNANIVELQAALRAQPKPPATP
jgi:predicted  nucleic acid-binding Zn-ribbon protein